jgi:hypothetical protein
VIVCLYRLDVLLGLLPLGGFDLDFLFLASSLGPKTFSFGVLVAKISLIETGL